MLHLTLRLTVIILGLGCLAARAQTPAPNGPLPAAFASGRKLDDVARWNDRMTPRNTLETFYFAISGYDRAPGLIANAIDCLDLTALDPAMLERDAALLAHQLEFILNLQAIPLYGVPDRPDGDRVVLDEVAGQPIVLARQPDGRWRFDSETVARIGRLRKLASAGQHQAQESRAAMAEGRTDPCTTMRSFAGAAMGRRDFATASRCLDLRDVSPKLRAAEGAQLAQARVCDATLRVHFLAGGPERPQRLSLRLALQPSRADHAGAGPPARGEGRMAILPGNAAQPRRPGRRPPLHVPRPAVRDHRRGDRRGCTGRRQGCEGAAAAGRTGRTRLAPQGAAHVPRVDGRAGIRRRSVRHPPGLPRLRRDPAGRPSRHRAAAGRKARGDPAPTGCQPGDHRRHVGGGPPGPRPRHRVAGHARARRGRCLAFRPRDRLSGARHVRAAHSRREVRPRAPLEFPLGAADHEDAPSCLGRR